MQMDRFETLTLALMADGEVWTTSKVAETLGISQLTANTGMNILCSSGKIVNAAQYTCQKPKRYRIA